MLRFKTKFLNSMLFAFQEQTLVYVNAQTPSGKKKKKKSISNFNTGGKCIPKLSLRLENLEFMGETCNRKKSDLTEKTGLIHGNTQVELQFML